MDVDGDGHPSLLDAYKWAAIRTNEHLRQLKIDSTQQVMADSFQVAAQSAQALQADEVTRSRREQRVKAKLERIYTQQEPWIENPSMAHQVRFADLPS